jgi:dTDP-3-amino-3,4,6-trideoxy-alpha-D-glucose transaminase
VKRFEIAVADAWPAGHVVATGNGLDAVEIALRTAGIRSGDLVLTTPLSAFATSLAILRAGAVPIFSDVDQNGLLDLDRCRDLCAQNPRIRALLAVHLYGQAIDLDSLEDLRTRFELRIVEDCAQSIHASWKGRATGSIGQVSATSFYPTKNLGAIGDGGAVLTSSEEIARNARALRNYGQSDFCLHEEIGLNSRLDEVHAAILHDALLPRLESWTRSRADTAARYLAEIRTRSVRLPWISPLSRSVWHLFPVVVAAAHRPSFVRHLNERGVMTGAHYPRLIPDQPAMVKHGAFEVAGELTRAREFAEGEVSLPIHPFLTTDEADHVIDSVDHWRPE